MFYWGKVLQFLQHDIYFLLSLLFLAITTFFYLKLRHRISDMVCLAWKWIFIVVLVIFILWSLFLSYKQYLVWKTHPFSRYLLPPYQKINYFLDYTYYHFWRDLCFRLVGILIIFLLMNFISFLLKRDVFYDEEKILVPYLSLFFFFPYNLIFFFLGLFMLNFIIIVKNLITYKTIKLRKSEVLYSFKNYWVWLAWLMLILAPLILNDYRFLQYKA